MGGGGWLWLWRRRRHCSAARGWPPMDNHGQPHFSPSAIILDKRCTSTLRLVLPLSRIRIPAVKDGSGRKLTVLSSRGETDSRHSPGLSPMIIHVLMNTGKHSQDQEAMLVERERIGHSVRAPIVQHAEHIKSPYHRPLPLYSLRSSCTASVIFTSSSWIWYLDELRAETPFWN